jgi:hypothetical protein
MTKRATHAVLMLFLIGCNDVTGQNVDGNAGPEFEKIAILEGHHQLSR